MSYRFPFFSLLLFGVFKLYGQTTIPVDIVKLSEITLTKNPTIKRNILSVNSAEGGLQIQKSTFDYQLNAGISLSKDAFNPLDVDPIIDYLSENKLKSKYNSMSLGLQKKFRTGLSSNLSINYSLDKNNYLINNYSQIVDPFIADHAVSSTFSLTQPLLKGSGKKNTTALEQASLLNVDSSIDNAEFANSYEIYQTGSVYWQYVTAYKSLDIYKKNETRVRRVLEITQKLVNADKKPAGDLVQIQADLANQERQTKAAEQALYSAKLNLGRYIGLSEIESKLLGSPLDEFPSISESGYTKGFNKSVFLEIAQENRKDILASKKVQEALELQFNLAANNKKPQLDLTGFVNYGGINIGNGLDKAIATFSQTKGRNVGYGLSLNLTFPVNNNYAKGTYIQNEVALKDQQIANENLQRNIDLNVSIALNTLDISVEVLEKAKESLNFYQEVYNNEQVKFKNGLTILLNLIQFQERLTFSELEYLQAHQQFASAIINLRYETGTLLASKNADKGINKALFYTIPNYN